MQNKKQETTSLHYIDQCFQFNPATAVYTPLNKQKNITCHWDPDANI